MLRTKRYLRTIVFGTAMLAPVLAIGCAAHAHYYENYRADYYRPWNDGEYRAYRVWLVERRYEYRDFNRLSREDQRAYWRWRHDHPGRY